MSKRKTLLDELHDEIAANPEMNQIYQRELSSLKAPDRPHACDLCGWRGPRKEREVNYWLAKKLWACRVCFLHREEPPDVQER